MIATTEPRIAAMLEGSKSEKKPLIKGIIEDKAAKLGFHWGWQVWDTPQRRCQSLQDGAPRCECWFMNPMNYSYIYHKPWNSAIFKATERYVGGPIL